VGVAGALQIADTRIMTISRARTNKRRRGDGVGFRGWGWWRFDNIRHHVIYFIHIYA